MTNEAISRMSDSELLLAMTAMALRTCWTDDEKLLVECALKRAADTRGDSNYDAESVRSLAAAFRHNVNPNASMRSTAGMIKQQEECNRISGAIDAMLWPNSAAV